MDHNIIPPLRLLRWIVFALTAVAMVPLAWSQQPSVIGANAGYLFVDGQYLQPPYDIQMTDDLVTINGQEFTRDYFGLSALEGNAATESKRMGRRSEMAQRGTRSTGIRGPRAFSRLASFSRQIELAQLGGIVVLFRQEAPLLLYPNRGGYELLGALVKRENSEPGPAKDIAPEDHAIWNRLVSEFEPTDEFLARATADIQADEEATFAGDRTSASNLLVAKISYPLTVFAMIIVVLGFGHLLSNRPVQDMTSGDSSNDRKVIVKSLSIIALFSIIDLVWTIAATNAGTMRELNPLGSQFIGDPTHLILFKLTVTGTSIGILYALHRKPLAQVASWWCCLLLTLLTARWVVFQSLFA